MGDIEATAARQPAVFDEFLNDTADWAWRILKRQAVFVDDSQASNGLQ
jgi:hypothetical protein